MTSVYPDYWLEKNGDTRSVHFNQHSGFYVHVKRTPNGGHNYGAELFKTKEEAQERLLRSCRAKCKPVFAEKD